MLKVNSHLMEISNNLPGMDIGERVRLERRKRKWSQEKLARVARVTQGLISQIENGTNDSSRYLPALAAALEVSSDWLATGRGDPRRREVNMPMSLHYPPMIEDVIGVVADPDGSNLVLIVFRDVNGTQVTLKLTDAAAHSLCEKLTEQGK
jgi:transcriptional regulator with XRE-family HTH domain